MELYLILKNESSTINATFHLRKTDLDLGATTSEPHYKLTEGGVYKLYVLRTSSPLHMLLFFGS